MSDLIDRVRRMQAVDAGRQTARQQDNRERFPEFAGLLDAMRAIEPGVRLQFVEYPDGKTWGEPYEKVIERQRKPRLVLTSLADLERLRKRLLGIEKRG